MAKCWLGTLTGKLFSWPVWDRRSSPSRPTAPTTMDHLPSCLVVDETVRCPWHHACFDLRTGEAVRAPALSPITCWVVVRNGGLIKVGEKREQPQSRTRIEPTAKPERIVIVGGGAAGFAAAEMLRRVGYARSLVMLSSDSALPYNRPSCPRTISPAQFPLIMCRCGTRAFTKRMGSRPNLAKPSSNSTFGLMSLCCRVGRG